MTVCDNCDNCDTPLTLAAVRVGTFRYCPECAPDDDDDLMDVLVRISQGPHPNEAGQ